MSQHEPLDFEYEERSSPDFPDLPPDPDDDNEPAPRSRRSEGSSHDRGGGSSQASDNHTLVARPVRSTTWTPEEVKRLCAFFFETNVLRICTGTSSAQRRETVRQAMEQNPSSGLLEILAFELF